jgi:hypothetical protein
LFILLLVLFFFIKTVVKFSYHFFIMLLLSVNCCLFWLQMHDFNQTATGWCTVIRTNTASPMAAMITISVPVLFISLPTSALVSPSIVSVLIILSIPSQMASTHIKNKDNSFEILYQF